MKHAGEAALSELEDVIVALRAVEGLREKSRGVFYRKSKAFVHFHEDPAGLFADVRLGEEFERVRVTTAMERATLLKRIRAAV